MCFSFKDYLRFPKGQVSQFIRIGTPLVLSSSMWGIAMGVQGYFLSRYGDTAVSADSVSGTVFQVLTVLLYGAAGSANIIIGKAIGENKMDEIPVYTRTLQILFVVIGLLTGAAVLLTRDLFLSLYIAKMSPETIALARQFLTVLSVTSIGTAYEVSCLTGIVRGGGDTKFVFYNDLIFMWLIILPASALSTFVFKAPIVIVFIILKSDQILKCFVAFFKVNSFNWIKKVQA